MRVLFQGKVRVPSARSCAATFGMRCAIMLSTSLDKAWRASRPVKPFQPAEDGLMCIN